MTLWPALSSTVNSTTSLIAGSKFNAYNAFEMTGNNTHSYDGTICYPFELPLDGFLCLLCISLSRTHTVSVTQRITRAAQR